VGLSELVGLAIGFTLFALGAGAITAWSLRRRSAERLLLAFGIWCVLYGVRLVLQQAAVRAGLGGSPVLWAYCNAFITYAINVPGGLFFEALLGPGWKQSIRRVWQVQAVYAVAAIAIDIAAKRPYAAMAPNRPLVLVALLVAVVNVFLYRRRLSRLFTTPAIVAGAFVLLFFVANENLNRPFAPAINLEPVGVAAFVMSLAYGVVGITVRNEAEYFAIQRELDTARQIQTSLLPRRAPRIRGLDVAVQYVPMTAVAGDLYDFVELGPSTLGILVADVSGHGVPAALVASMVKLAFSTEADHAHDPAVVLTAMNRALSRQLERSFVTAVYAVIDTDRGTMTQANAGHPPPMIARANRSIEEVGEHGMMLGFTAEATYTNSETRLDSGDVVFFYTDGVTESRNRAGEFLDRQHVGLWLESTAADAARITRTILDDLARWRGDRSFEDDVTFVIARFDGAAR
jgi:sigma-B regulation protein RsbU (phosphoserine phosphatase)